MPDPDDVITCKLCEKKERSLELTITCDCCFSSFHLKCKKINTKDRSPDSPFFCSVQCSNVYKRFANFGSARKLCTEDKEYIETTIKDALSEALESVRVDIKSLQQGQDDIRAGHTDLQTRCNQLEASVNDLEDEVEYLNKERVMNNVILFGIPQLEDENIWDIVQTILSRITYEQPTLITKNDIVSVFRFPKRNKNASATPIRVKFKNADSKNYIINLAKQLPSLKSTEIDPTWTVQGEAFDIFVREEATKRCQEIYRELKAIQKSLGIQFIWIGRNSVVLAKKEEGSTTVKVKNWADFHKVKTLFAQEKTKRSAADISPEQNENFKKTK